MKNLLLICMFFLTGSLMAQDPTSNAYKLIQAGNARDLSALFTDNLDLVVDDYDDIASKSQAEGILKKFFEKNPPKLYKTIQEGVTQLGIQYRIGELETANGKFKVTFNLKKVGESLLIHQFKIEKE